MSGNEIAQSGARTVSWRHVVNKAIRPIGPDSQLPFFGSYHSQGRVVFASQISTLPLTVLKPLECYLCLTLQQSPRRRPGKIVGLQYILDKEGKRIEGYGYFCYS